MKQNVNRHDFEKAFSDMGRGTNFTYEGRNALFDYLEEYEEGTGEEIELDVIALCCEYSEHDTALEAAIEYGMEPNAEWLATQDEEDKEEQAIEWLNEHTQVIVFNGGVIIAGF